MSFRFSSCDGIQCHYWADERTVVTSCYCISNQLWTLSWFQAVCNVCRTYQSWCLCIVYSYCLCCCYCWVCSYDWVGYCCCSYWVGSWCICSTCCEWVGNDRWYYCQFVNCKVVDSNSPCPWICQVIVDKSHFETWVYLSCYVQWQYSARICCSCAGVLVDPCTSVPYINSELGAQVVKVVTEFYFVRLACYWYYTCYWWIYPGNSVKCTSCIVIRNIRCTSRKSWYRWCVCTQWSCSTTVTSKCKQACRVTVSKYVGASCSVCCVFFWWTLWSSLPIANSCQNSVSATLPSSHSGAVPCYCRCQCYVGSTDPRRVYLLSRLWCCYRTRLAYQLWYDCNYCNHY